MKRLFCTFAIFFSFCISSFTSYAAQLAEDHTVLYYLIEMQRKHGAPCPQDTRQSLPSITPSDNLRSIAKAAGEGAFDLDSLIKEHGLLGAPIFVSTINASTPQAVVDKLKIEQCQSLMSPQYTYIGAAKTRGAWTVIFAGKEPSSGVFTPAAALPPLLTHANEPSSHRKGVTPLADPNPTPVTPAPLTAASPTPVYEFNKISPPAPTGFAPGDTNPAAPAPPQVTGQVVYTTEPVANISNTSGATRKQALSPATTEARQTAYQTHNPDEERSAPLITLINNARTMGNVCGSVEMKAPPLKATPVLAAIAKRHATDMVVRNYFSSTSPEGVRAGDRLTQAGIDWSLVAENISAGQTAKEAFDSWMTNEAQCKNIMNPLFTEVGVGIEPEKSTLVLLLAAPLPLAQPYPQQ